MRNNTESLKNPIGLKDFLTSIDKTNGYFINSFYELEFSFSPKTAARVAAETAAEAEIEALLAAVAAAGSAVAAGAEVVTARETAAEAAAAAEIEASLAAEAVAATTAGAAVTAETAYEKAVATVVEAYEKSTAAEIAAEKAAEKAAETENEFNKNFKCRCTNISIPDIRKNFTSIKYNGITVEVEQNLEFNHDLSLTIINDKHFTILYKILSEILNYESIGTNKPFYQGTSLRNSTCNINVYSIVDGIGTLILKLKDFKIKSISGLTFDQSDNSISKINIQGSIISYEIPKEK